jgi:beta-phosphoglucomutase family hydrolase
MSTGQKFGLPEPVRAYLFDMDGVLTQTAAIHAAAWKQMFDEFLASWSEKTGVHADPFDSVKDYDRYVDGRVRADGTRTFLQSRGISIPEGEPDDPPDRQTIYGLGRRKNEIFLGLAAKDGVTVFDGSVRYVRAVRQGGMQTAVVSASENTAAVLEAAGIADLFDVRIDGVVARDEHLRGKPAPDMYLAAARALGAGAEEAAVFEDALAGVEAGRAGGFAVVVGVDRVGQADELRAHGADLVVTDLAQLLDGS